MTNSIIEIYRDFLNIPIFSTTNITISQTSKLSFVYEYSGKFKYSLIIGICIIIIWNKHEAKGEICKQDYSGDLYHTVCSHHSGAQRKTADGQVGE